MNVIDSSAWLEYFGGGPDASWVAKAIEDTAGLNVPSITILEVFKRVYVQRGEGPALVVIAQMQQGRVIELDAALAVAAARLGIDWKLPLADSVILATAASFDATPWTQDADLKGLPGVKYRAQSKIP